MTITQTYTATLDIVECPNCHMNFGITPEFEAARRNDHTSFYCPRRAQKGQNTRLKNRIAAGVCPCCNRSFQNVARHMAGQHPDFQKHEEN